MAADMGFEGLRWLRSNGTVVENETCWLHRLDPAQNGSNAEANRFWGALRTVGTSAVVGAFRGPVGDRPHLQNWDDAGVVMAVRLADLLTRSGTMRWQGRRGAYSCDFGLGGPLYAVGTAAQIWNGQATVTIANLNAARADAARRANATAHRPPTRPATPTPVTAADVAAMQQALRQQMELADANWRNWTAR